MLRSSLKTRGGNTKASNIPFIKSHHERCGTDSEQKAVLRTTSNDLGDVDFSRIQKGVSRQGRGSIDSSEQRNVLVRKA